MPQHSTILIVDDSAAGREALVGVGHARLCREIPRPGAPHSFCLVTTFSHESKLGE